MTEQNVTGIQVSLSDVDKVNNTFVFQPATLANLCYAQREYITVSITDGREDLFREAMRHNPSVFLHSNNTLTVRFSLECSEEQKADKESHVKFFKLTPIFHEDMNLFDAAIPISSMHHHNKHKFQLEFACERSSQFMYPDGASAR